MWKSVAKTIIDSKKFIGSGKDMLVKMESKEENFEEEREREEVRKYLKLVAAKNVVQNDKKYSQKINVRVIWNYFKHFKGRKIFKKKNCLLCIIWKLNCLIWYISLHQIIFVQHPWNDLINFLPRGKKILDPDEREYSTHLICREQAFMKL